MCKSTTNYYHPIPTTAPKNKQTTKNLLKMLITYVVKLNTQIVFGIKRRFVSFAFKTNPKPCKNCL